MDNKNNVVVILLVILIGVCSGIGLLFGIGNAVGVAVSPMFAKVSELAIGQKNIEEKLASGNGGSSAAINARLSAIEQKLDQIDQKIGSGNANNNAPAAPSNYPPAEDFNKVYNIPVGISPIIGKKDAPVTITEFSDFQCPFCSHFYPVVKQVLADYPNQVRLVVKNFPLPFHPNARPAAKLAMAANEQGKFQGMMELLLGNEGSVSDASIKEYAQKLGLNYNKLMADYKNKDAQWEAWIKNDEKLAEEVDVRGTPTFYIDGRKTMARTEDAFKTEINKILAQKKG